MGQKSAGTKITRTGKKTEPIQTALTELQRKLMRTQLNDRFAVRFNPASPKKLISFNVKF